jgi:hypothetical protein
VSGPFRAALKTYRKFDQEPGDTIAALTYGGAMLLRLTD